MDGQVKAATPATQAATHRYRFDSVEAAKKSIEEATKAEPSMSFFGVVIDENKARVVAYCRYAPKPIIVWVKPSAIALARVLDLPAIGDRQREHKVKKLTETYPLRNNGKRTKN